MNSTTGRAGGDFATLLRDARLSAGLTQAELADRAGVGVRTVRDLERARALRPQRMTVDLLASALGLTGEDRERFVTAARGPVAAKVPRQRDHRSATPLSVPDPTPLIGRDRALAEVEELLGAPGVVTLIGLAGVGKSSLGLAVLQRVAHRFPGGVGSIAVSDGATEADLLAAVAAAFGTGRASDLPERLAGEPALLMVDGVEQSQAAGPAVRWLGREAPRMRILATGRQPLGLPGERVLRVEPLEVPPNRPVSSLAEVARYPAVELFLTRLREVRRQPVTDAEAQAIATLVRRLGGLPLALELAAARGRVLDANELLDRYGHRLLDLDGRGPDNPGQSLRAAVAGSYNLLSPPAQFALRRLAVFRDRWSVELAEDLMPDIGDLVAVLDRLVGLGLVTVRGSGPLRFLMLDVVREFALEQARAAGELPGTRRRHAEVMARFAARIAPQLAGASMPAAIHRLDQVAGDLWAALAYAADDDPHTALCLASKLPRWWRFRGRDVPGRQWLRRLLDDPRTADADPSVRAWAKLGVAQLAQEHGAGQAELATAEEALADFQALGHVTGELAARNLLCSLWTASGGYEEARRHGEAVLALATRTERIRDMAVAQNNLTWHEIRVGELAAARRRLAAAERLAAQCGEVRLRVLARANLAEVARLDGRYDEAVALGRAAGPLLEELGDPGHRRRVLGTVGLALAQAGRVSEAAAVLDELPATPADGVRPAIEGWLAWHRGDRASAAEWFAAAASASAGRYDARDLVEALVWLAASSTGEERAGALAHLDEVCRKSQITLLPTERALLASTGRGAAPAPH